MAGSPARPVRAAQSLPPGKWPYAAKPGGSQEARHSPARRDPSGKGRHASRTGHADNRLAIWESQEATPPGKRNYPALAAALQTLGYSVPGFIAAAVVGLDGSPIAQVTMDDTDISPLRSEERRVGK